MRTFNKNKDILILGEISRVDDGIIVRIRRTKSHVTSGFGSKENRIQSEGIHVQVWPVDSIEELSMEKCIYYYVLVLDDLLII